jgi:predicted GNAT superfamily acetyltransferase
VSALPPSGALGDPDHAPPEGVPRLARMEPRHHAEVLALNERHVAVLSPMDQARLDWILERASAPFVVEDDAGVLGFCIAMDRDAGYDGRYFGLFRERYASFLYLDRVAVDDRARRRGVGSLLYDACEAQALPLGRMLCEVNVVPMNATSMAFHGSRGYVEVDRVEVGPDDDPGSKVVAMLAKELGSTDPPV